MKAETFRLSDNYGKKLYAYKWQPDSGKAKAAVQLVHGIMEYSGRYEHFARELTSRQFVVYAHDHQGHGYTDPDHLGYIDAPDGFSRMCENIRDLNDVINLTHPDLPVVLFGHSMGAALAARSLQLHPLKADTLICSGIPGKPSVQIYPGFALAYLFSKLFGEHRLSPFFFRLIFGPYQKPFKPGRTNMDWLSRDIYNVDSYLQHPFCGFVSSYGMYRDLMAGLIKLFKTRQLNKIPSDLPIYLMGGTADPVCNGDKGLRNTERLLRESGTYSVDVKSYENGRHEMLQETNRQQVIADIITWIEKSVT